MMAKKGKNHGARRSKESGDRIRTPRRHKFFDQLEHPFTTDRLVRGPYSGQATALYTLRQRYSFSSSQEMFVLVAQPNYGSGLHVMFRQGASAGAVAAVDFTALTGTPWPGATVAATLFGASRCVGGGIRLVNTSPLTTASGVVAYGYLPGDAFTVLPATYSSITQLPLLNVEQLVKPVEVVMPLAAASNWAVMEYTQLGGATTSANLFTGTADPYGFMLISGSGYAAGNTFTVDVVFHYEALPLANVSTFLPVEISDMTYDEFERESIRFTKDNPVQYTRSGQSAVEDGCGMLCQLGGSTASAAAAAGATIIHAAKDAAKSMFTRENIAAAAGAGARYLASRRGRAPSGYLMN